MGDFTPGAKLSPAQIDAVLTFITVPPDKALRAMERFFQGGLLSEIKRDIAAICEDRE